MNYIGFDNLLNISNPSSGDVYDFMAGGMFDYYYAGSLGYSPLLPPKPDLRSIFLEQGLSLSAALLGFNEDFAEFVLMPMQIITTNDLQEETLKSLQEIVQKVSDIKFIKSKTSHTNRSDRMIDGNGFANFNTKSEYSHTNLANFYSELKNDSFIENTIEKIGHAYAGSAGAALAGMMYDLLTLGEVNGANIAEAVYGEFKNLAINTAITSGIKALGTSISPIGISIVAGAIEAIINEAFEVAIGLDRHYGFGGELNAIVGDTMFYDRNFSFVEGIRDFLGFANNEKITQVSKDGSKITGVRIGKDVYGYVKSVDSYGKVSLSLRNINQEKAKFNEMARNEFERLKGQDKSLSNLTMDEFGNVGFNLNTRDLLARHGYGNFVQNAWGDLKDQINSVIVDTIKPSFTQINSLLTTSVTVNVSTASTFTQSSSDSSEIFSRDSRGNFSFSNTEAGNMVEAMGIVGFGKGTLSIADMAKSMHLAKEIGRQKSNSSDKKEGSFSDSFNKDGTHKSGGSAVSSVGGFNSGGWSNGSWNSGSFGSSFGKSDKGGRSSSGREISGHTGFGKESRGQKSRDRQNERNGRR